MSRLAIHEPLSGRFAVSLGFLGNSRYGPILLAQGHNRIEHGLSTFATVVSLLNGGRRHPKCRDAFLRPDRCYVIRERSPNLAYEPVALFHCGEHYIGAIVQHVRAISDLPRQRCPFAGILGVTTATTRGMISAPGLDFNQAASVPPSRSGSRSTTLLAPPAM